jgi:hypothetical protein
MNSNFISEPLNDHMTLAAILLAGAAAFCLLALLLVAGFRLLRPDESAAAVCRQFVRQYGMHTIALVPAGQNLRHAGGQLPSVDLRYDPRLPMANPDAGLVFPPRPVRYLSSPQPPEEMLTGLNETE